MKVFVRTISFFGLAALAYATLPFSSNRSDGNTATSLFAAPAVHADVPAEGVEGCGESCECCGCECCECCEGAC